MNNDEFYKIKLKNTCNCNYKYYKVRKKGKNTIQNGKKLEIVRRKDKLGEKIDNLWGKSNRMRRIKTESKKLVVKLETD